jgi:hypothetical protein
VAIKIPIISEFNPKGIAAAQKEFESLTKTTDKTAFALKKMVLPAAAAFGAIVVGGYKAAQSASDLYETINKTNVIFGDASKEIQAFSQTAARELGMAKQEALDFAASFGGLGKMAGKTGDDLANFSTDLVTLTADMASFNNANPAEVALALGAALRGESEPIRRFNVLINDAAVKAEAMAMGLYSGTGNLDQQAKVLATHKLILKQTTDQQGDFNNTINSAANQQKILTATMKDATTSIGNAFLPILEAVLPLLVSFATFVEKNSGLIVAMSIALGVLAGAIVAANIAMNAWKAISVITAGVNYALAASFTAVQIATGIGIIAVVAGTAAFVAYKKSMESAKAEAKSLAGATNNLTGAFIGPQLTAKQLEERMKAFNTQGTGTTKTVESFAAALKEKLSDAVDTAKDKLEDAKAEFSDFATSVSNAVLGALDFNKALEDGDYGFAGFLENLRKQVKGIEDYSSNLEKALAAGLSQDALQYVLDAGNVAGAEIALELIKGGQAAIDETNALVDSAKAAADKIGLSAATKFYQSGVDSAQKMVDGLVGELDKMTPKLMKKMDEIAAKMKRKVNIDVVVTERVNKIISTFGGGIPAMAEGGIVNRPTLALIGEAGPEAVVPLSKMGAGGGGDVNINVNGGLATSAEIGQTVLNALRAYQRSAGPLNLNIA